MNLSSLPQTLQVIRDILVLFDAKAVRYVHWKSNINVGQALLGKDDLDILVHPDDAEKAERALASVGFVRMLSQKDAWQADIYHFLGVDQETGTIVHFHMHYALVLGFDYHKNFILPVIDWYLEDRINDVGIFVPRVEKEYIILLIRLLIKNARAVSWITFPRQQFSRFYSAKRDGHIRKGDLREVEILRARIDRTVLEHVLGTMGLGILPMDFARYEQATSPRASRSTVFRAAAGVKDRLRCYRAHGEVRSAALGVWRLGKERVVKVATRFRLARPSKKVSVTGGRIVAFVGGDGAGKSTNVKGLSDALRRHLYTEAIHVGRPGRCAMGMAYGFLGRVARLAGMRDAGQAMQHVALAYSRRAAFRRAERVREHGGVAVLDRIPLDQITAMDAPRILSARGAIGRRLHALERRLYAAIAGVDLIIVLRLDPEIACRRRPEDDRATLLVRSGEVWNGDWSKFHMFAVDTGLHGPEEVRAKVLTRVWDCIRYDFIRCEVIGLSGSGKSTVAKTLAAELANARVSLPYKKHRFLSVVSLLHAYMIGGLPTSPIKRAILLNIAQLIAFERMAKVWNRKGWPPHHYILDQGPTFQLVLALKEGSVTRESSVKRHAVAAINGFLNDGIISLEGLTSDALRQRVHGRHDQATRGKGMDERAFSAFAEDYKVAFAAVLGDLNKVRSVKATGSPAETSDGVMQLLTETRR